MIVDFSNYDRFYVSQYLLNELSGDYQLPLRPHHIIQSESEYFNSVPGQFSPILYENELYVLQRLAKI